jgi:hypothetical protein
LSMHMNYCVLNWEGSVVAGVPLQDANERLTFYVREEGGQMLLHLVTLVRTIEPVRCLRCGRMYLVSHKCPGICIICNLAGCECDIKVGRVGNKWRRKRVIYHDAFKPSPREPDLESDRGLIVRCVYDLETVTNADELLMPISFCNITSFLVTADTGVEYLGKMDTNLNADLLRYVDSLALQLDLDKAVETVPADLEMDNRWQRNINKIGWTRGDIEMIEKDGCQVGHYKIISHEKYATWTGKAVPDHLYNVCHKLAQFQLSIFKWMVGDCDVPGRRLLDRLREFLVSRRISKNVLVLNVGYHSSMFDELFMLSSRVYLNQQQFKIFYSNRDGRVSSLTHTPKDDNNHSRGFKVRFKVWDFRRHMPYGSLASVSKMFSFEDKRLEKGGMDMDLVSEVYNESVRVDHDGQEYYGDTVHIFRLQTSKYFLARPGLIDDIIKEYRSIMYDDWDSLGITEEQAIAHGEEFYLPFGIVRYNMLDCIATVNVCDGYQRVIERCGREIALRHFSVYHLPSSPSMGYRILEVFLHVNRNRFPFRIYYPQQFYELLVRQAVYGGRSQVFVVGHAKGVSFALPDINGMYGVALTSPFPMGPPMVGNVDSFIDEIQDFLRDCKVSGFREGPECRYERRMFDFGAIIAKCFVAAPTDRRLFMNMVPVPCHDSTGALVWTYEARSQILSGEDMENLARCGWSVFIDRTYPYVYWPVEQMSCFMADYIKCMQDLKLEADGRGDEPLRNGAKLLINSMYGILLRKSDTCKRKIIMFRSGCANDESRLLDVVPNVYDNRETWKETAKYGILTNKIPPASQENMTPVQLGCFVLSKSRFLVCEVEWWARNMSCYGKVLPEDRSPEVFASETDSFHVTQSYCDRLPKCLFSDKQGGFNVALNTCEFYLTLEKFADKTPIYGRCDVYYVAKKVYYVVASDNDKRFKFASKGSNKKQITIDLLMSVLRGDYTSTTRKGLSRKVPGTYSNLMSTAGVCTSVLERALSVCATGMWVDRRRKLCDGFQSNVERLRLCDLTSGLVPMLQYDSSHQMIYSEPARRLMFAVDVNTNTYVAPASDWRSYFNCTDSQLKLFGLSCAEGEEGERYDDADYGDDLEENEDVLEECALDGTLMDMLTSI